MENNFKGTKGIWTVDYKSSKGQVKSVPFVQDEFNRATVVAHYDIFSRYNIGYEDEEKANAQLIADAGNVRQQIPFDLPELLKQRNELLEMVKMLNQVNPSFSLYDEAKSLITKCEGMDNG